MIITEWIPLRPPLDTARCEIFPHSGGISQLQAVEPDSTTVFSPHFNHYADTVGASCRIASASACTSIARAVRPYLCKQKRRHVMAADDVAYDPLGLLARNARIACPLV